jgi:eight-cysteine-cluster-containing protein
METREWNVARRRLAPMAVAMGTGLVVLLAPEPAEACSCLSATVESSHFNNSDAATLTPLAGHRVGSERWYLAQVTKPYKGCTDAGDLVLLVTPSSSASCGAQLELGIEYLVHGDRRGSILGIPTLAFNACDYNLPATELSDHDRDFLAGRQVCCGDECSCADGSQPVQCFVDPCEATAACSEAVTCEANYCGGCNAEFYDASGFAVCQLESECQSDADCPGEWCRQAAGGSGTEDPRYECVPFVNEGDWCEGFTPPEFFERCAPGLICDTPDLIADASGICRAPCQSDADCDEAEYCASDASCDSDGQCEISLDCSLAGNSFSHPDCVGYGTCDIVEGCGWTCGDPACVDLWGYEFGNCDAVLGWGNLGRGCREVSGCSSPVPLFESQATCEAACSSAPPACTSDDECAATGCSGQVCAAEPVLTTCEFRPEYACFQDPAITSCGCNEGQCAFAPTPELAACIEEATADPEPISRP